MRLVIVVLFLLVVGAVAIISVATYSPSAEDASAELDRIDRWEPTMEQVKAELRHVSSIQEQKQAYGRLFRLRYRRKNIPVNLRTDKQDAFYLECASTIPNWDKAIIAQQAWREIRELFGQEPQVFIYESYIGVPSRWVGTAKPDKRDPTKPEIVFDTGWHLRRKPRDTDFLFKLPRGG
ncbi:MAG: hypothetical protein ACUVSV_08745 [Armatimonadota bacterium]